MATPAVACEHREEESEDVQDVEDDRCGQQASGVDVFAAQPLEATDPSPAKIIRHITEQTRARPGICTKTSTIPKAMSPTSAHSRMRLRPERSRLVAKPPHRTQR